MNDQGSSPEQVPPTPEPNSIRRLQDDIKQLKEDVNAFKKKLEPMRKQMDNVMTHIRDCMLEDTGHTHESLQSSYNDSAEKLKISTEAADGLRSNLLKICKHLTQRCEQLRTNPNLSPEPQYDKKSISDQIRRLWFKAKQVVKKELDAEKLASCKQDIDRRKNRLTEFGYDIEAAKEVSKYNLDNTPRLDALLEKSNKYINWSALLVVVPYMSVYMSKLFLSHLDKDVFIIVAVLELAALFIAWIYFIHNYSQRKVFLLPTLVLLGIPTIHILYLSFEVGYSFRTSGLTTFTIIDASFVIFLLVLLSLYSVRKHLLSKFNSDDVIKSRQEAEVLFKAFINDRFRLFLWRLLFLSVGALFLVSTIASWVVSMNDEDISFGEGRYTPIISENDRVIMVGPNCSDNNGSEPEGCDKDSKKKVISIPSSSISCVGSKNACPEQPAPEPDKIEDTRLSIHKVTVRELKALSVHMDASMKDTDPAYKKLMTCLDETKASDPASFRVDFLFCRNKSDNYALASSTRSDEVYTLDEKAILNSDVGLFLNSSGLDGEYHYVGAASDPGEVHTNLSLGEARIGYAKNFFKTPSPSANIHDWPFGPLPPIDLDQLLSEEIMKEMEQKNICPGESFEQIIQQFAQVVYCPVENN